MLPCFSTDMSYYFIHLNRIIPIIFLEQDTTMTFRISALKKIYLRLNMFAQVQ